MEVTCKAKCQCCNAACKSCSGFQKILDLKDAGLVIYRYTKHMDEIDKITGNIESSVNTTDDVIIIHNTKDVQIKTDECVTELGDEVSCPRCRELVQRAQKYLKNTPNIDKKDVISVCDHCKIKKQSNKYCCECHDVVKTFLLERRKETIGKEEIKKWLSKIHKLLSTNVVINKITKLKHRAHSELYINNIYKDDVSSTRKLEVGPMLDVGVKIDHVKRQRTKSTRLIDQVATKSDSALKCADYKRTKFKSGLVESSSFIKIDRHASSSLDTYDTSLDKDTEINKGYLEQDSLELLRQKRKRDKEFSPKTAIKRHGSPKTLKRYYSDEKIFFPAAEFDNLENLKTNFSYVFPREESEQIKPLRRVKTSAELIEDTQDRLRLRAKLINDEINRQLAKRNKISSSKKQKQLLAKTSDEQDIMTIKDHESVKEHEDKLEEPSSKESKTEDKEIKSDKDETQKDKKEKVSSKKAIKEDKEIKIDKDKIQKDIKERPSTKKAKLEDTEMKSGIDKTQKVIKDRPSSKETKTEDTEMKIGKVKIQKDKQMPQKVIETLKGKKDQKKEDKVKDVDEKQVIKKEKKEVKENEEKRKDIEKKEEPQKEKEQKNKEKLDESRKEKGERDGFQKQKEKKDKEKRDEFQKDKEKMVEFQKKKDNMEEHQKEKEKEDKEKNEEFQKDEEKKEKERKEETQKEKERKEKEKQIQQALKDEEKKPKEETIKNKDEKPHKGDDNAADNFRKMIEEQAKLKAEALNIKKQQEEENRKLRMEAEKKTKEAEPKLKVQKEKELKETKIEKKLDKEEPKRETKQEQPTIKELNIKQIKIRNPSTDDLILRLVRLKQANKKVERPKRLSEINVTPLMVKEHKVHKAKKILNCAICVYSDLELDVENIVSDKTKPDEVSDLIVGNKIIKSKHPLSDTPAAEEMFPVLYKSLFKEEVAPKQQKEIAAKMLNKNDPIPPALLSHKYAEPELSKGIIRYALSDRSFIDKGWTMLPTEKVVRKMNVYRMRPAHPEFDWFDRNKNKRLMLHDTGEKFAEFDDNGRGRWFYRNGRLALDYYDAEEMNAQQRFVIYGSGEPDERGRSQPISILATFDYLGNGVVFDHTGKIRLKYNQTEGVVLDRGIGPVSHWKWHTLNDPPVLQQVMIDTQMAHKDPNILKLGGPADDKVRPDNEEMLAIEFDNFIKEKSKKLTQKFKPFQIRTKALKINENFSLRVLDQANIYLIFRDGTTNTKINIGMILDHQEIVDTDTAEVGEVSNNLERFPARTDSLAGLQRSVAYAQRVERLRVERERRLKHPEKALSVDHLVAAASRPLRSQLKIAPSGSIEAKDKCFCKCKKPSSSNVYYDTRLV